MKQALMAASLLAMSIATIVIILSSNFQVNKATMFEQTVSQSLTKSLEDMCFYHPDLNYEQIINGYLSDLAVNLNGTNRIKVDVIAIDRNYGIIDTINELTYNDFFNNEKTITLRKTIIHNPQIQDEYFRVDFVFEDAFKGALFVNPGTTIAQAISDFAFQADWNLSGYDIQEPIERDIVIYAN